MCHHSPKTLLMTMVSLILFQIRFEAFCISKCYEYMHGLALELIVSGKIDFVYIFGYKAMTLNQVDRVPVAF